MLLKVAGSALNQTPFDWRGNEQRIRQAIELARKDGATVLCLPELCITGYSCEDVFFNPHVQERALDMLLALLPATTGMIVAFGLPMKFHGGIFNTTAVVANGEIVGLVPKKHLAGDGVHYEPRWFKSWPIERAMQLEVRGRNYPFGDIHFDFAGLKMGLEICEEAWVAQRPGAALARRGVDIILNPSASHFAFGKLEVRRGFVCEGSRAFNVAYVYSNLLGNEAGRIIFDGGALIADGGQLVAQGERLSFKEVVVTSAVIDINRNRVVRSRTSSFQPSLEIETDLCVEVAFAPKELTRQNSKSSEPRQVEPVGEQSWERSTNLKEEEFSRAVALGLFDFVRKSHQNGFVISLSGGLDSAAVTILCRLALDLAVKELGLTELKSRLGIRAGAQTVDELAAALITTAYQATENSSKATLDAARAVAGDAGATFYNWNVDRIVGEYREVTEGALGQKLNWKDNDTTLQNIQARARGPAVWALANVKNALLLATSNRSEAAVGYATMDGDTCGGISPIGGIDKNFLRTWARWMCDLGPDGLRSFPSLALVLSQPPTAELRPLAQRQTDEIDLMPYEVLDAIEKLAIRDKKSPTECYAALTASADSVDPQLRGWVAKFFRLWCRNQWKRERYAPAFHLDDESLDPKTWCRFPILSGGFEEELAELESLKT